ncbi:MAG: hypothetical protein KC561_06895 [Myxococcales bacterium]|nr:hypothetical protein [Myxococcales bacterium]
MWEKDDKPIALVVSADRTTAESLTRDLTKLGLRAEVAVDSADAEHRLYLSTPEVALVDLRLPDEQVLDIFRELRRGPDSVPAVALVPAHTPPETLLQLDPLEEIPIPPSGSEVERIMIRLGLCERPETGEMEKLGGEALARAAVANLFGTEPDAPRMPAAGVVKRPVPRSSQERNTEPQSRPHSVTPIGPRTAVDAVQGRATPRTSESSMGAPQLADSASVAGRDARLLADAPSEPMLFDIDDLVADEPTNGLIAPSTIPREEPQPIAADDQNDEPAQRAVVQTGDLARVSERRIRFQPPRRPTAQDDRVRTFVELSGELSDTPVYQLLIKAFVNRMSGTLTVGTGKQERTIYILVGEPVFVKSSLISDSLGGILVQTGVLTVQDISRALDQQGPGELLGQVLLKLGMLSPKALIAALERQTYERVLNACPLDKGTYVFRLGSQWMNDIPQFPQNPVELVAESVRRFSDANQLAGSVTDQMNSHLVRTEKCEDFLAYLPVSDMEEMWLGLIDGQRTVRDFTVTAKASVLDFLSFLNALVAADMVFYSDTPSPSATRPPNKSRPGIVGRTLQSDASLPAQPLPARDLQQEKAQPAGHSAAAHSAVDHLPPESDDSENLEAPDLNVSISSSNKAVPDQVAPPKPSGDPLRDVEQLVISYYLRLPEANYWELLGLEADATPGEVRVAYRNLMERFDANLISQLDPIGQRNAEQVLSALRRAFNTLVDPMMRLRYADRATRKHAETADRDPDVRREQTIRQLRRLSNQAKARGALKSSTKVDSKGPSPETDPLERAQSLSAKGFWEAALEVVRAGVKEEPNNAELVAFEAWCVFNLPTDNPARRNRVCRQRLILALTLSSHLPSVHYFLGQIAMAERKYGEAAKCFRDVVHLDPDHAEAKKMLKKLKDYDPGDPSGSGGESGLVDKFKKLFS